MSPLLFPQSHRKDEAPPEYPRNGFLSEPPRHLLRTHLQFRPTCSAAPDSWMRWNLMASGGSTRRRSPPPNRQDEQPYPRCHSPCRKSRSQRQRRRHCCPKPSRRDEEWNPDLTRERLEGTHTRQKPRLRHLHSQLLGSKELWQSHQRVLRINRQGRTPSCPPVVPQIARRSKRPTC